MKKLLTILFLFAGFVSNAQIFQNDPAPGRVIDGYKVRKVLFIPTTCGVPGFRPYDLADQSAIAFDSCGHQFYIYDPSTQSWNIGSQSSIDSILSGYYTKSQIDSITANFSGTDSSAYHDVGQAPDSTYFTIIKPDGTVDTVRLVGDTTSVDELRDTAAAIRNAIPLPFNPIAGTNITLSGSYPNITFNSSGGSSTDTTSLSNRINTKIDSVKLITDSLFAKVNGTWVFQFKSSAFNQWRTNGTAIYYNTGNVGIGDFSSVPPPSKLTIMDSIGSNTVFPQSYDSKGINLIARDNSTSAVSQISPPLVLTSKGWSGSAISNSYRIFSVSDLSGHVSLQFYKNINGGAYSFAANIDAANNFNIGGNINAVAGNFSLNVTSPLGLVTNGTYNDNYAGTFAHNLINCSIINNIASTAISSTTNCFTAFPVIYDNSTVGVVRGFYFNPSVSGSTNVIGFQNETGNNFLNTTSGGTSIGATTTIPTNRIFQVTSTSQVSHPNPNMTTAQRDAISSVSAGDTIFCTDCTANDSSTGVTQTYNGSTWKNLW